MTSRRPWATNYTDRTPLKVPPGSLGFPQLLAVARLCARSGRSLALQAFRLRMHLLLPGGWLSMHRLYHLR